MRKGAGHLQRLITTRPRSLAWRLGLGLLLGLLVLVLIGVGPAWAASSLGSDSSPVRPVVGVILVLVLVAIAGADFAITQIRRRGPSSD
jgi:hypothetical protein